LVEVCGHRADDGEPVAVGKFLADGVHLAAIDHTCQSTPPRTS
jgi:hypothetical protein